MINLALAFNGLGRRLAIPSRASEPLGQGTARGRIATTSIESRINKLEHRFGTARDAARYIVILTDRDLSDDEEAYIEMLHKAGSFPGGGVLMVNFMSIPCGLTAIEIDRFVRENEAKSSDRREPPENGKTPIIHVELE